MASGDGLDRQAGQDARPVLALEHAAKDLGYLAAYAAVALASGQITGANSTSSQRVKGWVGHA
jgi:hypothetical protein